MHPAKSSCQQLWSLKAARLTDPCLETRRSMRSTGRFTSVRAAIYKRQLITYHNQTDKILISFHVSQMKVANKIQACSNQ